MFDLLFDPPLIVIVGLLMIGAVLLYNGMSRGVRGVQLAGAAVIAAAVVIYVVGRLVETGPERVTRLTADIVAAADRHDWTTFGSLLDPKVRFAMYSGRDELTKGAAMTMDRVGVKNVTTGGYEVTAEPGGYQVAFAATADIDVTGHRTPTNWRFYWAKAASKEGYELYRIEPLPTGQFGTDAVTSRLEAPPK